jgi:hypothetical protein
LQAFDQWYSIAHTSKGSFNGKQCLTFMGSLERFIDAQRESCSVALNKVRMGHKRTHWMWFVFPQLIGHGLVI